MAQSINQKKIQAKVYGLGASVVILGALFKLLHWEFWIFTGSTLLAAGLITEALIFAYAAFEPIEEDLDWALAYPELKGGASKEKGAVNTDMEAMLSKKLDVLLQEAKIDAALMERLGSSIKSFEGAAKNLSPTTDAMASTQKYAEELLNAAKQMEALNGLYKSQIDSASAQASVQENIAQNAAALKAQMEAMTSNLASLNGVYNGMLTAMNRK